MLDWLLERGHLKPDWQERLKAVRAKVDHAVAQLPAVAEAAALLRGEALHYYHCRRMLELLESAQQASDGRVRNWFGQYTSATLRGWSAVLHAYERDNLFLGEAARVLVQNAGYTCPALRRAIAQYERQIGDYGCVGCLVRWVKCHLLTT